MNPLNQIKEEPLFFVIPYPVVTNEIQYEWHNQNGIKGLLIDRMDENGDVSECFFLQSDRQDVEGWIFQAGTEDEDFYWEGEWDDSEGERGGMVNKQYIIEDNFDDNVKDFIQAHKHEWKKHI